MGVDELRKMIAFLAAMVRDGKMYDAANELIDTLSTSYGCFSLSRALQAEGAELQEAERKGDDGENGVQLR